MAKLHRGNAAIEVNETELQVIIRALKLIEPFGNYTDEDTARQLITELGTSPK